MIVMKFGGTSVGDGKKIKKVAKLVNAETRRTVVVVSAMGGVTDKLIETAERIVSLPTTVVEREVTVFYREMLLHHRDAAEESISDKKILGQVLQDIITAADQLKVALLGVGYLEDLSPRSLDYIMSFGEKLCSIIMAGALNSMDAPAKSLTGYEAGLITNSQFGEAHPNHKKSRNLMRQRLLPLLKKGVTPVITGFVAGDENARITTLGRGGSDFTASLIGNYLGVKEVQIWTDVNGIMTTDPKIVRKAKVIPTLSYVEAMDLAYFGAKVIHSKMIEPSMVAKIPVRVLNTFNPKAPGTLIVREQKRVKDVIKAAAVAKDVSVVTLSGVGMAETPNLAGRAFSVLGENKINVMMISGSSESNLSFVVRNPDLSSAIELLSAAFEDTVIRNVGVMEDVSILTVVGAGMHGMKGIAAKVFQTVAKENVNIIMIAQGSSEVNIAFVVKSRDAKKALKALHKRFIE